MAQSYYVNVESTGGGGGGSGIGYRRVIPQQYTSYRTGDTGWHLQNGTFDYTGDSSCVAYIQDLATTVSGSSFYELLHPNAFGNNYRFTNDIGNGPDVGNAGFSAAGFTGATPNYIIDHLTGLAFSNYDEGLITAASGPGNTWQNMIDLIYASTENGHSDWFPLSVEHVMAMFNMALAYQVSGNIGYGITAVTLCGLGDTVQASSANVYFLRRSAPYLQIGAQTPSNTTILKARNHY